MMVSKEEMVDVLKTAAVSRLFFLSRFVSCYWGLQLGEFFSSFSLSENLNISQSIHPPVLVQVVKFWNWLSSYHVSRFAAHLPLNFWLAPAYWYETPSAASSAQQGVQMWQSCLLGVSAASTTQASSQKHLGKNVWWSRIQLHLG